MRVDQIGLQLYTVRRPAATDLPGTLRAVADAGFRDVELAGLPDLEAEDVRGHLDAAGLEPIAAHVPIEALRADPAAIFDWLDTLRCPRAVIPWLPPAERSSPAHVREIATELGSLADEAGRREIRLAYHNHDFEFAPMAGTSMWEVLLRTLPASVDIELDVYWATVAGRRPVEVIEQLGRRVRMLHMKDRAPGTDPVDAPAGTGTLDWAGIVEAAQEAGVEWYIVEQDEPSDPIADAAAALRYLRSLAAPEARVERTPGTDGPHRGHGAVR
ncbi:MAG TPA: sugar phosphate isomerase/epimerase [Candidatus Limnocylindrales bacterium]|jgi:sugar phosphate isomerase/epimerase